MNRLIPVLALVVATSAIEASVDVPEHAVATSLPIRPTLIEPAFRGGIDALALAEMAIQGLEPPTEPSSVTLVAQGPGPGGGPSPQGRSRPRRGGGHGRGPHGHHRHGGPGGPGGPGYRPGPGPGPGAGPPPHHPRPGPAAIIPQILPLFIPPPHP